MKGMTVITKAGFLKWAVSAVVPMALLNSQASYSMPQEDLSGSPSTVDVPLNSLPPNTSDSTNATLPSETAEQAVISPQTPYQRQQYYLTPSSDECRQSMFSRPWYRRSFGRRTHFVKLPPAELPPAGENLNTFWAIQVSNGEAARMVLYDFDFVPGQPNLTPRGTRQLARFADMLQQTPHPLIIQPSPQQPTLDEFRRAHVFSTLVKMNVPVHEDRLIVRIQESRGLDGIEAEGLQVKQMGLSSGSAGAQGDQSSAPQTGTAAGSR